MITSKSTIILFVILSPMLVGGVSRNYFEQPHIFSNGKKFSMIFPLFFFIVTFNFILIQHLFQFFFHQFSSLFLFFNLLKNTYLFPGRHISDLDSYLTQAELEVQAARWQLQSSRTIPNPFTARIGKCLVNLVPDFVSRGLFMGGPGVFGSNDIMNSTYNVTGAHSWIAFSISLHTFNFDETDKLILKVGSKTMDIPLPNTQGSFGSGNCKLVYLQDPTGTTTTATTTSTEYIYYATTITGQIFHSASSISVSIQSVSSKNIVNTGAAISDIQIILKTNPSALTFETFQHCPKGTCLANPTVFTTTNSYPLGSYWNTTNNFYYQCHQSCLSCHYMTYAADTLLMCNSCPPGYKVDENQGYCQSSGISNTYRVLGNNGTVNTICLNGFIAEGGICKSGSTCSVSTPIVVGLDKPRECITACTPGSFMAWNFTCVPSCPALQIRSTSSQGKFCDFGCADKRDYLYSNGSCINSCSAPMFPQILAQPGSYKTCNLDETHQKTEIINGVNTTLFFQNLWVYPNNEKFVLDQKTYKIDSAWTFFGLETHTPLEYSIPNWDSEFSCGCDTQKCGDQCSDYFFCNSTENMTIFGSSPISCSNDAAPGSLKHHYCWNLIQEGVQTFQAYKLKMVSVIAWLDFGGYGIPNQQSTNTAFPSVSPPGFTITQKVNNQSFASNALIVNWTTVLPSEEIQEIMFATSEDRVVLKKHLEIFNNTPEFTADLNVAHCNDDSKLLKRSIKSYQPNSLQAMAPFTTSHIVRRSSMISKLYSLDKLHILTPSKGVQQWNPRSAAAGFVVLDPCNQQFLTLLVDSKNGAYSVKAPGHQKLLVQNVICIAVNLDSQDTRYLDLFETQINGTEWIPSSRFRGVMSPDFVDKLQLQVTTVTSPPLNDADDDDDMIQLDINADIDPPQLLLKTHASLICDVFLSPNCSLRFQTTSNQRTVYEDIEQNCGFWYERVTVQCDGFIGYIFPPSSLVQAPIQDYDLPVVDYSITTYYDDNDDSVAYADENNRFGFGTMLAVVGVFTSAAITGCCFWLVFKKNKSTQNLMIEMRNNETENDRILERDVEDAVEIEDKVQLKMQSSKVSQLQIAPSFPPFKRLPKINEQLEL